MSFLDRVKKNTPGEAPAQTAAPAPKASPFAKKKEEGTTEATPATPKTSPFGKKAEEATTAKKANPFAKKKEDTVEAVDPIEQAVAQKESEEESKKIIEEAKAEVVKETPKEEAKEEPKEEVKEDKKEEVKEEPKTEEKTPVVEKKPEPQKKPSRKRNQSAETAEVVDTHEEEEVVTITIPKTTLAFDEALKAVKSSFVDEEWEATKAKIAEDVSKIVIASDMNPATLKVALSELSRIRQEIWLMFTDARTQYEMLSSEKPEGLIGRVKAISYTANHKNDMDRKKAGIMACLGYQTPEGLVNLYELLEEMRERYFFLKSVMDSIQYKTDALITMSAAIKAEEKLGV